MRRPSTPKLEHPEWLLLAALILDTAGEDTSPVQLARRIAQRFDLGAAAEQEIALLVGDSGLYRAAARKLDALEEERVYPIAAHLEVPERARALYLLTLGLDDLAPPERERLDELHRLVMDLLDQPAVTGLDTRNLVERRRAEAIRIVGDARQRRGTDPTRARVRISSRRRRPTSRGKRPSWSRCRRAARARVSVLQLDPARVACRGRGA